MGRAARLIERQLTLLYYVERVIGFSRTAADKLTELVPGRRRWS
jgi:hypothetical protein